MDESHLFRHSSDMKTVLVVEHEACLRRNILALIEAEGFQGLGIQDCHQGLQMVRQQLPDLIICDNCDHQGPSLGCQNLLDSLQQDPATAQIPCLILAAQEDWDESPLSASLSSPQRLIKPLKMRHLRTAIAAHLGPPTDAISSYHPEVTARLVTAPLPLELLQAFFDGASSALVGFCLLDDEFRFIAINETLARINGYTIAEHLGNTASQLLPELAPTLLPIYRQLLDTLKPIVNLEVTGAVPSRPGITRHWNVSYVPVQSTEGRIYIGAIVVEVTGQKQLIAQLEAVNLNLKRSNQDLEQFAHTASHDLQEPLRIISSYAQLLERRYGDHLEDRGRRYLTHIFNGAARAQQLVRDLLAYARLDAQQMKHLPVDLQAVWAEVLELFEDTITRLQAQITWDPLPMVLGDRQRLTQVFQNLLSNALKFHLPPRPPQIHLTVAQTPQHWQIAIQDNGIGIDPQYSDRIFAAFQRLNLPEDYEGTGIGLFICQRVIEQHGGHIWVESSLGQGSTFYLTLPLNLP